jgi:hypothetical protein
MPSSNKAILRNKRNKKCHVHLLNIDEELVYWNFFLDFGPLNLGQLYRFSSRLNYMLQTIQGRAKSPKQKSSSSSRDNKESSSSSKNENPQEIILFFSSTAPAKRANAIFLICAWQLMHMGRSPEDAWFGFNPANERHEMDDHDEDEEDGKGGPKEVEENQDGDKARRSSSAQSRSGSRSLPPPFPLTSVGQNTIAPLPPFHDASPCACTYELTLLQCLYGLQKARQMKFFDWENFNVEEYEHFEQVEVRVERYSAGGVSMRWWMQLEACSLACHFLTLSFLVLAVRRITPILYPFFLTEWRFELDNSRQNLGLCRTVLQEDRQSGGILYLVARRIHSVLSTKKGWIGRSIKQKVL